MRDVQNIVYSRDTVEFVTVAAEFCAYLEQSEGREPEVFRSTLLKLLPLLYLKATLLPRVEAGGDSRSEQLVTEQDYEWLRAVVAAVMGPDDEYLDVSPADGLQTEETRLQSVSEGLADIYQAVRNFVGTYKHGVEESMYAALWELTDSFELYWGERVVDTLRVLHRLHYVESGLLYED